MGLHQLLISYISSSSSFLHLWYVVELFAVLVILMNMKFLIVLTKGVDAGLTQFIGTGCLVPTVMIFLGYGLAVTSSTYCLTFLFSDHSVAQVCNLSDCILLIMVYKKIREDREGSLSLLSL
jgi:ATP-binding cassette, subfamily A (ABC1), member 3